MSDRCRGTASSTPRWPTHAYEDRPLAIGYGQTISQPYMVARATELAAPRADRSRAGGRRRQRLPGRRAGRAGGGGVRHRDRPRAGRARAPGPGGARRTHNVTVDSFDGSGGWPEHAPYDVIIVSAGAPRIPALLVVGAGGRRPAGDPGGRAGRARTGGRAPRGRPLRHRRMTPAAATSICWAASASAAACRRRDVARPCAAGAAAGCAGGLPPVPAAARRCTPRAPPGAGMWSPRARAWRPIAAAGRRAGGRPGRDQRARRRGRRAPRAADLRPRLAGPAAVARRSARTGRRAAAAAGHRRRRRCAGRWPPAASSSARRSARARAGRTRASICRRRSARPCSRRRTGASPTRATASAATATWWSCRHAGRSADRLRAQLGAAGGAGTAGARGRSHRAGRPERPRDRSPLAFRGPVRSDSSQPDGLPARAGPGVATMTARAAPNATPGGRCCARASATSPTSPSRASCSAT